ncbi:DUF418 domain-containing protein [Zhihengliuella flava]|uniref:Membrane protein YeiB n=1 Tax=Zhihengliuella flava TaxID=1285193 RepID=A0A931GEB9_9MICC|nr:DUF418 domain-containing protein [Zhihengliuella flava]MBG6084273.1 putative membrane protein YeiB [Zhihengliuella flava]
MTRTTASSPAPGSHPARPSLGRVAALDAARAVAIVGMMAVNVGPRDVEGPVGLLYQLPAGRASLLFMVLAGVGMSILTRTARQPGGHLPWQTILWRAALLLVGGLALQMLDHEVSVILPTYGFLFLICMPLLRRSNLTLAVIATASTLAGPLIWLLAQRATGQTYDFTQPVLADAPRDILEGIVLSGSYPAVVWIAPFVLGLLLGRADLRARRVQVRLAVAGAATALIAYVLSQILIVLLGEPSEPAGWTKLVSAVDHSQMPLWLISGTGSAVLILGIFLLAEDVVARRLKFLCAAGRLSLTVYVGHLLVLAAWVRPEPHTLAEGILITLVMAVAALIFASVWTRFFATGPLEFLFRWPRSRSSSRG